MSTDMSTAGLLIVCGERIVNRHPSLFALESIQIVHGHTCGTLQAPNNSPQTPVLKVHLLAHNTVNSCIGYRGEKPFEAIESKLLAKYISKTLPSQNVNPIGYVDFHSYSQLILYPFAYDCDVLPRDAEDLAEAAWGAAKAARQVHGRYFDVDSACEGDSWDPVKKVFLFLNFLSRVKANLRRLMSRLSMEGLLSIGLMLRGK